MNKPCPECAHEFDWWENFEMRRGGESFNSEFGQTEYWVEGIVMCPKCEARWYVADSSL